MIWFGSVTGVLPPPSSRLHPPASEGARMEQALTWVAARAPHLTGPALVDALADTGWVDRPTAERLLPAFRGFDPDRYFAEDLRRLSFRGAAVADEFRLRVARAVEDMTGSARIGSVSAEGAIRFGHGDREGIVIAYPEVGFTLGARTRDAVLAAVEEMPDALVVIARNFGSETAGQLGGILARTEVPGTLLTVNLLLGMRAIALRYQPPIERVVDLLGAGRPLRSADIATLGGHR